MKFLEKIKSSDWIVPAGLVALSLIPVIAGAFRLNQISNGTLAPENMRFQTSPAPIVLHLISAILYSLLGAFQFSPGLRRRFPKWHRQSGKILIITGLLTSLTGLWMTLFYVVPEIDQRGVYIARLIVGVLMTLFIYFGMDSIRKRNFSEHGEWMIRAYALAMGAGTQVLTHLPLIIFPNIQGETSRTIFMSLAWLINIAVAEWIIRKPNFKLNKTATITT